MKKKTSLKYFPVVVIQNRIPFPGISSSFTLNQKNARTALSKAVDTEEKNLVLLLQKDPSKEELEIDDIYELGVLVQVQNVIVKAFNYYEVRIQSLKRVRCHHLVDTEGYFEAQIEILPDANPEELADDLAYEAKRREIIKLFAQIRSLTDDVPVELTFTHFDSPENHYSFIDIIATSIVRSNDEAQKLLEQKDLHEVLDYLLLIMKRESELAQLTSDIQKQVEDKFDRHQRDKFVRESIRLLQSVIGEDKRGESSQDTDDAYEIKQRLKKGDIPKDFVPKIKKEIKRLARMHPMSPDYNTLLNWLETIAELPFESHQRESLNLKKASSILNKDHYGLEKVKERILEYIAVRKLQVKQGDLSVKGPILCFVGPPGVGKTSIAQSIANSLGRKYIRMSLGGIRDEAEIRGHRRTYVGAMPGRIIQGLRHLESSNPLFLLDEIDKISSDYKGDPASALLEVLDPEQNHSFRDHYLEIPYDLSKVMFVTTANSMYAIPDALRDRMEIISLTGYTNEEKLEIARRHLLPNQLKLHALEKKDLRISKPTLRNLISWYTREAGVRQLERELAHLCRKVAINLVENPGTVTSVTTRNIEDFLGKKKFLFDHIDKNDQVGVARGLAWTAAGGDTLAIEVNILPGEGKLELTGRLGQVMQESAKAAYTYIKSRASELDLDLAELRKLDVHIHVPDGATAKDGPSAGITLATAVASALTKRPVRHDLAMTGEISLRGRVMEIGGLKEKAVAASRAKVKHILIPKDNTRDLDEVPETVLSKLEVTAVESMDEVLKIALV